MIKPIRRARALKAQKSRSVVKTIAAPTGGWNARDAIADMPETDAVAMVNIFPQTTDVTLRYGSASQGHLGTASAGNAMLLDGITGYATTPDTAAISVTGDIDLRCYANLDNWTTASAQFFLSKDGSYQFFVLNGRLGALLYPSVGTVQSYLSDSTAVLPVSNGFPLWVRFTCDIDAGAGVSVGTFYTGSDGSTWTALGSALSQYSLTAIANTAAALELGDGVYPSSVTYNNPALLTCDSADFDGTNDYMTRGGTLTGAADSKTGIFSAWLRLDGGNGTQMVLLGANPSIASGTFDGFAVTRASDNKINVFGFSAAGSGNLQMTTGATFVSGASWIHILASWNTNTSGQQSIYINDVADFSTPVFANSALDVTKANWTTGGVSDGTLKLNGCLAEPYFAPAQYLDFSVTANRRKFISSAGKPVFLGTNGSLPTGTAPLLYFHLDDAEAPADFATNRGTGGNFTITGTLTTGSTSPSD